MIYCLWLLILISWSSNALRPSPQTSASLVSPRFGQKGTTGLHITQNHGTNPTRVHFKKTNGNEDEDETRKDDGFFNKLKSYIPGLKRFNRARSDETAPDAGYRFELRLTRKRNTGDKRHIITRIMRFLPDIQWETACDIYDTAFQNEKAVVRVLNSEREALELRSVLLRADPPVFTEIFDLKRGEVIV